MPPPCTFQSPHVETTIASMVVNARRMKTGTACVSVKANTTANTACTTQNVSIL